MKTFTLFVAFLLLALTSAYSQCSPSSSTAQLNVNNVRAALLNVGDLWWDGVSNNDYVFPVNLPGGGTGTVNANFSSGLWLSALDDNDSLLIAAMTYRNLGHEFYSGPIDESTGTVTPATCSLYDRFWEVTKDDIESFTRLIESGLPVDSASIPNSIREWPAKGNPFLPVYQLDQDLAPFIDLDNDGVYNPTAGDYPDIKGDQALFCVFNDVGNDHFLTEGRPLGVEIHFMAYAYTSSNPILNNTTFYDYTIINKSGAHLNDFIASLFVDCDLGEFNDDYVGCDTNRHCGYVYNATPTDAQYGTNPPIVSTIFLNQEMNVFSYFNNAVTGVFSDPTNTTGFRNVQTGKWPDGLPLTVGGNGRTGSTPTRYTYPSNPDLPAGPGVWSEASEGIAPDDRRYQLSARPINLSPMEAYTLSFAVLGYETTSYDGSPNVDSTIMPQIDELRALYLDSLINGNQYDFEIPIDTTGIVRVGNMQISAFPNPSTDIITISGITPAVDHLVVVDALGRVIKELSVPSTSYSTELDVQTWAKGIYFLTIDAGKDTGTLPLVIR